MLDPRKDNTGLEFKYFWLKVASKQEVLRQRKDALEKGTDERMIFTHPLTIGINPKKKKKGKGQQIHLGLAVDRKKSEANGMLVDAMPIDSGYDYETALDWIDTDAGREWAGGAYCVLCYAAVETA